jgi:hypothetical protein
VEGKLRFILGTDIYRYFLYLQITGFGQCHAKLLLVRNHERGYCNMASLARSLIRQSISLSAQSSRLYAARSGVSHLLKSFNRANSSSTDPKGKPKPQT